MTNIILYSFNVLICWSYLVLLLILKITDGESDDSANKSEGEIDDGVKSACTNDGHVDGNLDDKDESEEEGLSDDSSKRENEDECENSGVIDDEFITNENLQKRYCIV